MLILAINYSLNHNTLRSILAPCRLLRGEWLRNLWLSILHSLIQATLHHDNLISRQIRGVVGVLRAAAKLVVRVDAAKDGLSWSYFQGVLVLLLLLILVPPVLVTRWDQSLGVDLNPVGHRIDRRQLTLLEIRDGLQDAILKLVLPRRRIKLVHVDVGLHWDGHEFLRGVWIRHALLLPDTLHDDTITALVLDLLIPILLTYRCHLQLWLPHLLPRLLIHALWAEVMCHSGLLAGGVGRGGIEVITLALTPLLTNHLHTLQPQSHWSLVHGRLRNL